MELIPVQLVDDSPDSKAETISSTNSWPGTLVNRYDSSRAADTGEADADEGFTGFNRLGDVAQGEEFVFQPEELHKKAIPSISYQSAHGVLIHCVADGSI
jgi:hypothetical protein